MVAHLSAKPAGRTGQRLNGPRGFNGLVTLAYAGKRVRRGRGEGLRPGAELVVGGR